MTIKRTSTKRFVMVLDNLEKASLESLLKYADTWCFMSDDRDLSVRDINNMKSWIGKLKRVK